MIIDGQAHASGPFLRGEGIARTLDSAGVDRVVMVSGVADGKKTYSLPRVAHCFPNTDVVAWTNRLTIERVRSLSLSDPEKDLILGWNIRRLLDTCC